MHDAAGPVDMMGTPTGLNDDEQARWARCLALAASTCGFHIGSERHGDALLREHLGATTGWPADEIVVTAGIRASALPLLRGVTEVVMERPSFADVPRALVAAGLVVRRELWATFDAGTLPLAGYWATMPYRNPDGATAGPALRRTLSRLAQRGCTVVCDTAFGWFGAFDVPPGVAAVGSLHKLAGPGARLGWAWVPGLQADVHRELWAGAPAPQWQRAWSYFFDSGHAADLRARRVAELDDAWHEFTTALGDAMPPDTGGGPPVPHLLLPVSGDEATAVRAFADAGVLVGPGRAFASPRPAVRVSLVGVAPGRAALAGRRIAAILNQ